MKLAMLLLFITPCFAQRVVITYSHQPLETFKAAFLSKLNNVAMYEALMCSQTDEALAVSGGQVLQGATTKGINVINKSLVALTVDRARSRSKKRIAAEIMKYAALTASVLTAGEVVAASTAIKVVFPSVATLADRLEREWSQTGVSASVFSEAYLDASKEYILKPRNCASALFFGGYKPKFEPAAYQLK